MLDDFFFRALLAGVGIALIAGPLGCFVIWRRLAYFGDTMAHSALLGVSLSLLLEIDIQFGVFAIAALLAVSLTSLQQRVALPGDTILGILSHSTLAIGLIVITQMSDLRIDLHGYLFGDILAVGRTDLMMIYAGAAAALITLIFIWRPLLTATVNEELSQAEGQQPRTTRLLFLLLLAIVIAASITIVGVLLITALLIIPAATARQLASSPERMAAMAAVIGMVSAIGGLYASLLWDTPPGPGIVIAALLLFLSSLLRTRGR